MKSTYNPFATAYPPTRGPLGKIFRPVVDFRTYLRAGYMLLMFPLGIAYFVLFVVTLTVGGAMIWTLVGPVILLAALFISRWLGDLEALIAGYVNGTPIKRPPSRLEGVSNFRSQVWVRIIDPTTWTGLIYLVAQFPIGIAAFVGLVVVYAVSGAFVFAPLLQFILDEPIELFSRGGSGLIFDTPLEALQLTPFGILGFFLAPHLILAFSSLHSWWARLMLGSRSTRTTRRLSPTPDPDSGNKPEIQSPEQAPPTPSSPPAIAPVPAPILTLLPNASELAPEFAPNTAAISELTPREQEVFILVAHGDTNADIAEELFISEGTVKTHVKRVFSKLEMRDRAHVVVFAYEHGLVVPHSGGEGAFSDGKRSPVPCDEATVSNGEFGGYTLVIRP